MVLSSVLSCHDPIPVPTLTIAVARPPSLRYRLLPPRPLPPSRPHRCPLKQWPGSSMVAHSAPWTMPRSVDILSRTHRVPASSCVHPPWCYAVRVCRSCGSSHIDDMSVGCARLSLGMEGHGQAWAAAKDIEAVYRVGRCLGRPAIHAVLCQLPEIDQRKSPTWMDVSLAWIPPLLYPHLHHHQTPLSDTYQHVH